MSQRRALVLGGAGFVGMALTKRLMKEGYWVRSLDWRFPPFGNSPANEFYLSDLRVEYAMHAAADGPLFDEVFQLACDMGGAGYIFTGEHDADVIANNVLINTQAARAFSRRGCGRLLYTSSSCVYNDEMADRRARETGAGLCEWHASPASSSTRPPAATTASMLASRGSRPSTGRAQRSTMGARRRSPPSAARSLMLRKAAKSRFGATATKYAHSSISTICSMPSPDWCAARTSTVR